MEKFPRIDRVIGNIETAQDDVAETDKKRVLEFEKLQREKTKEELLIIELVDKSTDLELQKYGVKSIRLRPEDVLIVDEDKWESSEKVREIGRQRCHGFYSFVSGKEVIRGQKSKLRCLALLLHETIHYKSYHAQQLLKDAALEDTNKATVYRNGLRTVTRDGSEINFAGLDEAVTDELAKRIFARIAKTNPLFEEESRETEQAIAHPNREGKLLFYSDNIGEPLGMRDVAHGQVYYCSEDLKNVGCFHYALESKWLREIIQGLYSANTHKFKNEEEIFDLFVQGMLTGNILPIAKLVDKTFGKGRFRELGKFNTAEYLSKCKFD